MINQISIFKSRYIYIRLDLLSVMASHAPKSSQVRTSDNYLWNRLDVLGQGATCEVYKAYHKTSGEPAAVKVFNKSGMARDLYQQKVSTV